MEYDEKSELIKDIVKCMEEVIQIDSDDSERGDICEELTNICDRVTQIPIKKNKRQWVKVWRTTKAQTGSHSFLIKELLHIDDDIMKQDTVIRVAISATEKLSLTLRFLATGKSFQSLLE